MGGERQFCTFSLGGLFLGVEVLKVQEVIRAQAMTRVPLAPTVVRGLINLRGQIVTAVDLRERFGLPARSDGQESMNVIVHTEDGAVSLLVDDIGDVLEVQESDHEEPPETLDPTARSLILGVYKLPERLLLVLDLQQALTLEPSGAAGAL